MRLYSFFILAKRTISSAIFSPSRSLSVAIKTSVAFDASSAIFSIISFFRC